MKICDIQSWLGYQIYHTHLELPRNVRWLGRPNLFAIQEQKSLCARFTHLTLHGVLRDYDWAISLEEKRSNRKLDIITGRYPQLRVSHRGNPKLYT